MSPSDPPSPPTPARSLPEPAALADRWSLDPGVVFLNHGSFGACPTEVLDVQRRWQDRVERQPIRFFAYEFWTHMDASRRRVGAFVGADPDDIALVTNATAGTNTVLRSLDLGPSDEILVTSQEYPACRNAVDFVCRLSGAGVREVDLPWPATCADDIVAPILAGVTDRTRLALVSHISSPTGMVLPIERIVHALAERGVDTLVDGAHSPGQVPLDLDRLGAAYYTGNFHKWVCTPKGSAFLHVRRDRQDPIRPLVISHGATAKNAERSRFRLEHDWLGTFDPSALLSIPDAIDVISKMVPDGWEGVRRRNHDLALHARDTLCDAVGTEPPLPADMIGSLAAVTLPDHEPIDVPAPMRHLAQWVDPLELALLERWGIQVQVVLTYRAGVKLLRVSSQLYNSPAQLAYLADALRHELRHR